MSQIEPSEPKKIIFESQVIEDEECKDQSLHTVKEAESLTPVTGNHSGDSSQANDSAAHSGVTFPHQIHEKEYQENNGVVVFESMRLPIYQSIGESQVGKGYFSCPSRTGCGVSRTST